MHRVAERRWGKVKPLAAGQLIRQYREHAGVASKRLCAEIGMHTSQLSDIERGVQQISLRRAFQIASVLGLPFDDVVSQLLQERLIEAGFKNLCVHVEVVASVELPPAALDEK